MSSFSGTIDAVQDGTYTIQQKEAPYYYWTVFADRIGLCNLDDVNQDQRWYVKKEKGTGGYTITNVRRGLAVQYNGDGLYNKDRLYFVLADPESIRPQLFALNESDTQIATIPEKQPVAVEDHAIVIADIRSSSSEWIVAKSGLY
ncbi:uncharacterized protein OCT59_027716 [Rhizophagus irregularis]|uniref:uncharacterized protein n=1 Tax=Rhizophagus irregularis TaxID=588596 RepID=UPI0019EE4398|nr:hypothetical protein OCT59_027716 [Rhizophagus irregularis]GBC29616.2 hypothetical protein RIR_jg35942.t1 [Rhizophagus irregularis DAOM 181602=DAOM 197198]